MIFFIVFVILTTANKSTTCHTELQKKAKTSNAYII